MQCVLVRLQQPWRLRSVLSHRRDRRRRCRGSPLAVVARLLNWHWGRKTNEGRLGNRRDRPRRGARERTQSLGRLPLGARLPLAVAGDRARRAPVAVAGRRGPPVLAVPVGRRLPDADDCPQHGHRPGHEHGQRDDADQRRAALGHLPLCRSACARRRVQDAGDRLRDGVCHCRVGGRRLGLLAARAIGSAGPAVRSRHRPARGCLVVRQPVDHRPQHERPGNRAVLPGDHDRRWSTTSRSICRPRRP